MQGAPQAALLLALTGGSTDLALSMTRAAALAQPQDQKDADFLVLDTGGTAEGAGLAGAQAVAANVGLILGPLYAREVPAVVAAAGERPVLTFSNDASLRASGAFILGITASQGVSAVLDYARSRGVRRVVIVAGSDPWSRQSVEAATEASRRAGLVMVEVDTTAATTSRDGLDSLLMAAAGGALPDAVLFCRSDPDTAALCVRIVAMGIQVLGPSTWIEGPGDLLGGAEGAWIAAPDPQGFAVFAQAYEARHSSAPGLLAALAFDGAAIMRRLRAAGRLSRAGLTAPEGFHGVLGAVRFDADGSASRELAIQVVSQGATRVVARATGR